MAAGKSTLSRELAARHDAVLLVQDYPTKASWTSSIAVVRALGLPLIVASTFLFALGVSFCYFFVFGQVFGHDRASLSRSARGSWAWVSRHSDRKSRKASSITGGTTIRSSTS